GRRRLRRRDGQVGRRGRPQSRRRAHPLRKFRARHREDRRGGQGSVNAVLKEAYREPVKPKLISERIKAIRAAGVPCVVSTVPARAEERAELVQKAGADVLVVQGTVLTARHSSRSYHQLAFDELVRACDIPVVVGNCVQYDTALELMETGIAGILVGVGPGAACTTRGVLGVGVPQVTATADVAAARDEHMRRGG